MRIIICNISPVNVLGMFTLLDFVLDVPPEQLLPHFKELLVPSHLISNSRFHLAELILCCGVQGSLPDERDPKSNPNRQTKQGYSDVEWSLNTSINASALPYDL
jgi:hypothetical protein